MAIWNFERIYIWAEWAKSCILGAQLQDNWTNGEILILQFYKNHTFWLAINSSHSRPSLGVTRNKPRLKKTVKPLSLFLNSHAVDLYLFDIQTSPQDGRFLRLCFSNKSHSCELEFVMIPRAVNIIVSAEGKKVSLNRIQKLPPSLEHEINYESLLEKISSYNGWEDGELSSGASSQNLVGARDPWAAEQNVIEKSILKKQKAIKNIEDEDLLQEAQKWEEFGNYLKTHMHEDEIAHKLFDRRISKSKNLELAYYNMKKFNAKIAGRKQRIEILKEEILSLEKKLSQSNLVYEKEQEKQPRINSKKLNIKAQRISVDPFEIYVGKSGKDNLALLRMAKSWDLWVHIKDEISAHAIIMRPRNRNVPEQIIRLAAEKIAKQSKRVNWGRLEVIVVECRHVKPVKGDSHGRVYFHHPKVYTFAS